MEPKTKPEKRVIALSLKIKPVTQAQRRWMEKESQDKLAVLSRKTTYCLECGYYWKEGSYLSGALLGFTCPNCKAELKYDHAIKGSCTQSEYMGILDTVEDWQVVRMFFVTKLLKKKNPASYSILEVMQHWISPGGQLKSLARKVQGLSLYFDQWIQTSSLEFRSFSYKADQRYSVAPFKIYQKRRVQPNIVRNGWNTEFFDLPPHKLFSMLLSDPKAETLIKTDQVELLKARAGSQKGRIDTYWPSIRICIRNNYRVTEPGDWFDYLSLLKHFGKDLTNPKYICPCDLKKEHDRYVRRKQEQIYKENLEKMKREIDHEQEIYRTDKGCYFGLSFTDGNLTASFIEQVTDLMHEAIELKHCVFANRYHAKPDSLLFSAKIDGKRIETVEFSLTERKVKQARGLNNLSTKYHDRIVSLVESHSKDIYKRKKSKSVLV